MKHDSSGNLPRKYIPGSWPVNIDRYVPVDFLVEGIQKLVSWKEIKKAYSYFYTSYGWKGGKEAKKMIFLCLFSWEPRTRRGSEPMMRVMLWRKGSFETGFSGCSSFLGGSSSPNEIIMLAFISSFEERKNLEKPEKPESPAVATDVHSTSNSISNKGGF